MDTRHVPQAKKQRHLPQRYCPTFIVGTSKGMPSLMLDAVLPEQFYDVSRSTVRTSGYVALVRAVLNDAIGCYQKQALATNRRARRLAREAEEWLFSNDERWPFAFLNVCAVLGLEPDSLRRGLQRLREHVPGQARQKRSYAAPVRRFRHLAA
ncbi:MAG: hypothetical protein AB7G75_03290 [Candidatus Binatia bacterium]